MKDLFLLCHCERSEAIQPINKGTWANSRKGGFTLAEVLITLGIIGVVAAITMPTLIQNYKRQMNETFAKEVYSIFSQATLLATTEQGESRYWNTNLSTDAKENNYLFSQKYIVPYLKGVELCSIGRNSAKCAASGGSTCTSYNLSNGIAFGGCINNGLYVITVNRKHAMYYYFVLDLSTGKFLPAYYSPDLTLDDFINGYTLDGINYTIGCNNNDNISQPTHGCTALLYMNGWKFPKNLNLRF